MKKILIISFTDTSTDPRVLKQINALKDSYDVIVIGTGKIPDIENIKFVMVSKPVRSIYNKLRMLFTSIFLGYEKLTYAREIVQEVINVTKKYEFDIIISNDLETLPVSLKIAKYKNSKVLFDAHEYYPDVSDPTIGWYLFRKPYTIHLCKEYLHKVDIMTTVCDGIAEEYVKNFNIQKPLIIDNSTFYREITPVIDKNEKIRIIHHGGALPERKLEIMIDVLKNLDDNYELNFMLVPNDLDYMQKLKDLSKGLNVIFLPPSPVSEIPNNISKFDIGLYLLEATTINHKFSLPNKLFEFIQARLAIVIGPSPEMAKIVKKYDCGIVTEDFSAEKMALEIRKMTIDKINYYKEQSNIAAKELCAEENAKKINQIVSSII